MSKIKKPELLAPAGDWPSLRAAVKNGADSIYFGIKSMNMRDNAENFDVLELKKVMQYLHENAKKGYLSLNIIIMNDELSKVEKILIKAKEAKVDAVILWDMAVLSLAKKIGLEIHISTQASVSNITAIKEYVRLGAKRIIMARECTLADLKEIKKNINEENIDCEMEAFIHGAMCVSVSGRCFLSLYSHGLSANKGKCVQPCRREYLIKDKEEEMEFIVGEDYLLSPKDLCAIDFIEEIINSGIDSLKIEGRMRSPEYVKAVVSTYRKAIDLFLSKGLTSEDKKAFKSDLSAVYNRGFSTGFYFGQPQDAVSLKLENTHQKVFLGTVTRYFKKIQVAEIALKSAGLARKDEIIFIGKNTAAETIEVKEIALHNKFIDKASKGDIIGVKVPFVVKPKDKVFRWEKK